MMVLPRSSARPANARSANRFFDPGLVMEKCLWVVVYLGNVEPGEWTDINFRRLKWGHDVARFGADEKLLALMRVRFHHDR